MVPYVWDIEIGFWRFIVSYPIDSRKVQPLFNYSSRLFPKIPAKTVKFLQIMLLNYIDDYILDDEIRNKVEYHYVSGIDGNADELSMLHPSLPHEINVPSLKQMSSSRMMTNRNAGRYLACWFCNFVFFLQYEGYPTYYIQNLWNMICGISDLKIQFKNKKIRGYGRIYPVVSEFGVGCHLKDHPLLDNPQLNFSDCYRFYAIKFKKSDCEITAEEKEFLSWTSVWDKDKLKRLKSLKSKFNI